MVKKNLMNLTIFTVRHIFDMQGSEDELFYFLKFYILTKNSFLFLVLIIVLNNLPY